MLEGVCFELVRWRVHIAASKARLGALGRWRHPNWAVGFGLPVRAPGLQVEWQIQFRNRVFILVRGQITR